MIEFVLQILEDDRWPLLACLVVVVLPWMLWLNRSTERPHRDA